MKLFLKSLPLFVYIIINSLFLFKYATRQDYISPICVTASYVFLFLGFLYLYTKLKNDFLPTKKLFWGLAVLFFLFTIFVNVKVDGNGLNVDRWSAMSVAIKALLNGEYPYSAVDHLGGRTSNLPFLIVLGIPFYLMGNIGLLQSFTFGVFVYVICHIFKPYRYRLFCLILLILSPSYWWEIYVKSDLMSNFIVILLFLSLIQLRFDRHKKVGVGLLSFGSSLLLLTRLTSVIPLSLLLFKKFYFYSVRNKVIFLCFGVSIVSILLFICFKDVESWAHFRRHNPLELQNRQLPTWVGIATVLLPLFFSFRVTGLISLIKYNTWFLLIPIVLAFGLNVSEKGIVLSVLKSGFDISYFNIAMPFLIVYCVFEFLPESRQSILPPTLI